MALSRIPTGAPHITRPQGQRDNARKSQKLPELIPHPNDLYWHPMTLPLPGSPHFLPITRLYFPSRRLHGKLATAADLPVELFDLVLSFVYADKHKRTSNWMVSFSKRDLGRAALVCRRWASICQTKIFERISLRSRQDSIALSSIIVCPGSMVPRLIRYLWLSPANFDVSAPWIHLVCQKILPRMLHPDLKVSLCLLGKKDTPLKLGKSVHASLPRQLPVFSSGIRELDLYDVHFGRLEDLARLIGEMPSLQEVGCNHVTWPPLPDGQLHLTSFITRRSQLSVLYKMFQCTDNAAAVLLASQIVPVGQPRLGIDDVCAMYCILRAVSSSEHSNYVWSEYVFNSDTGSGVITVDLVDYGKLVFITPDAFPQRIASIDVQIGIEPKGLQAFPGTEAWKEVDNCVRDLLRVDSELNPLEWIRFSFRYPKLTKEFADEIVGLHMPYLSSVDNLVRYGVNVWPLRGKSEVRPVTLEEIRDTEQRRLICGELDVDFSEDELEWEQVGNDEPDSEDTESDYEDRGENSEGQLESSSEDIEVESKDDA